ncbi:uncharacterized protein LOC134765667 [Penaeus indicus]|uniref:uncharacterized protein LOC134765667 n=1 Tax=Penaeus indicus TaxID=29960 RepID=UPI00300CB103
MGEGQVAIKYGESVFITPSNVLLFQNEETGGLSSQDLGKSVRRQIRERPTGRSLDAYRENLPRQSHRRFSEQGRSKQSKDDLEEEYEHEDLVSHPGFDFRNGSEEDRGFLSSRKSGSPRMPASKSPGWAQAVSHSPRTDTYSHSAEVNPRRAVQHRAHIQNHDIKNERDYQTERNEWEGIKIKQEQENGTEMEVDEDYGDFKVFEESMREAYHRNSHGGTSQGSRPLSNADQKHSSLDEIVNKFVNGRQMLQNAVDGSFGESIASSSKLPVGAERSSKLQPELIEHEGFFQIGHRNSPGEESYVLSITIVFAKNLEQLMPNKLQATSIPACFSYSLLGYPIKTDPIKDLKQPNFLAERAAGKIRATPANLSAYFTQNPQLQIHLLIGDLRLASTSVNLSSFEDAGDLSLEAPLIVEGGYSLVPVVAHPADVEEGKDPVLGIVAELSKVPRSDLSVRHPTEMVKIKSEGHNSLNSPSEASSDDSDSEVERQRQVCRSQWGNVHHNESKPRTSFTGEMLEQKELASEIHKQRLQLLCAAAIEVETWKEDQQELFWKQWCARESELQQHLAAEWRVRVNTIESNLRNQIAKCDTLQSRLSSALTNLSAREVIVKNREQKLKWLEDELEQQRQILKERDKSSAAEDRSMVDIDVWEELVLERKKRRALEKQVEELKGRTLLAETKLREEEKLSKEASNLRKEKEKLSEQLAAAVSRKQYYKLQWVRSISQLHQLHVAQAQDTLAIKSEVVSSSPEPLYPSPSRAVGNLPEDNLEDHMLFLEPTRDARGNKVSPKKSLQVQRAPKAGNGVVSENAGRLEHRRQYVEDDNSRPRRRSSSSSRLSAGDVERTPRTRRKLGSGMENDSEEFEELSASRKRPMQGSPHRGKQERWDLHEEDREMMASDKERKLPRAGTLNTSLELERLMRERESLLEMSDFKLYESRLQNVEKKIRDAVEL